MTTTAVHEMERRYHVRYEAGPFVTFPVTHRLDGRPMPYTDGGIAAWGCVTISNLEHVQWRIVDATGRVLIHGTEQNLTRSRRGYVRMLRTALKHMRDYGGVRVYPRERAHRAWAAGSNPWTR